jgi:hypothetical protein
VSPAVGLLLLVLASVLAGCAGTRVGQLGVLPSGDRLVTVVVTQDRDVLDRECRQPLAPGRPLGCQSSRQVLLPGGGSARAIKVVRYADVLPSEATFRIEVHELCHVVATLQTLQDPCHAENAGLMELAARRRP